MERLRPFMFDGGTTESTKAQRLRELEELEEIRDASRMCALHFFAEAAWNEEVHYPVLKLALKSYGSVVYRNVYGRRRILHVTSWARANIVQHHCPRPTEPGSASCQRRYSSVEDR